MNPLAIRLGLPSLLGAGWGLLAVLPAALAQESPADAAAQTLPAIQAQSRRDIPRAFRRITPLSVRDLRTMETRVRDLVRQVAPAVVSVRVGGAEGSAVVISPEGLVLTAAHVCGAPGRDVAFLFPDGTTARGITLGTHHGMDAGLMRIAGDGRWPSVSLGTLEDAEVGDWVLSLGHPGGFDPERTIVARLGRLLGFNDRLVLTDCTIVSGDSGGPLFDMHGRVVGIHSRISDSTAENFHVPVGAYLASWERLLAGDNWGGRRSRSRPWVGVWGADGPEGCVVESVVAGGPADKAGMRVGDLLLQIEDRPIKSFEEFMERLRESAPGEVLKVRWRRAAEEIEAGVTVESRRARRGRSGE
jgi:serine protease Do